MRLYGLRILIALITFAAGVAAASLWGFLGAPLACPAYRVAPSPVAVAVPPTELRSEPSAAKDGPLERCKLGQLPPGDSGSPALPVAYSGLLQNRALSKPMPKYPAEAKAVGVEGDVMVQVLVGEDGGILTAEALSGHELLRDAALGAACRSRFSPTLISGQPVRVRGVMTYKFLLQ